MQIGSEFLKVVAERYAAAFTRDINVINQLNDEQVWHRPSSKSNSIGIIIQHLTGNLNQWIGDALGGYEYQRQRELEFKDEKKMTKDEMVKSLSELGKKVNEVILKIKPDDLLSRRKIQGLDVTILQALVNTVTHFELHSGQITYIAKLQLNDNYQEQWRPPTK